MEPMNDEDLKDVLREWRAPGAPKELERKVFAAAKRPGLLWLLTGSVRVPVPALVLALIVIAALFYSMRRPEPRAANQSGLAGFQPVHELNPRVVGRNYEVQ
jgi:hypothetical protein